MTARASRCEVPPALLGVLQFTVTALESASDGFPDAALIALDCADTISKTAYPDGSPEAETLRRALELVKVEVHAIVSPPGLPRLTLVRDQ